MRALVVDKKIARMLAVKVLRPLWRSVVWSPLSPARLVDLGDPLLPGPRWVRVRNHQCGICATDLSLLFVRVDPAVAPAALPGNTRFFLGHEVVGEVVETGTAVTRFQVGDRVVMESRFAGANCHSQEIEPTCAFCAQGDTRLCENASVGRGATGVGGGWGDGYTAHETELWPVADGLDDDQASLVEPVSVALHGVLRHPPQSGQHVLVIGAGIIGLLTAAIAKALRPDCQLTVLARHPHQAEAALQIGADHVITDPGPYRKMAEITGAKLYQAPLNRGMMLGGFEVIYDCVGDRDSLSDGLRWARAGGAVVMLGVTLSPMRVDLNPIWYQEVDLIGSHTHGMETWNGKRVHAFDLAMEMMREGVIDHRGLITHRFPFEDYHRAIATADDKRSGSIKVVFEY
jgi:threonine dehydrogenase-like Zn-dependent dehydrogenase